MSEKTVSRITQEGKVAASNSKRNITPEKSRPRAEKIDLDGFDPCAILHKIHQLYTVKKNNSLL